MLLAPRQDRHHNKISMHCNDNIQFGKAGIYVADVELIIRERS